MRGIADTAYVLHEWGRCTFSLRKLIMFIACLEAHLIPVVTLTSLVILPVYYNIFMLLSTGEVEGHRGLQQGLAPQLTHGGLSALQSGVGSQPSASSPVPLSRCLLPQVTCPAL